MIVLAIIWVIAMFTVASIAGFRDHLPYLSAFLFALCISFTFLMAKKWIYGLIGLCISGVLFYAVYLFEPNWLNTLYNR